MAQRHRLERQSLFPQTEGIGAGLLAFAWRLATGRQLLTLAIPVASRWLLADYLRGRSAQTGASIDVRYNL